MEKALKIESNEVTELFNHITQAMRWNLYPPCPQPENVIGLNPHSDVGALTILLQANEIEGLQIRKDGQWIPVQPLPNAFVINIGDMLEVIGTLLYQIFLLFEIFLHLWMNFRKLNKFCIDMILKIITTSQDIHYNLLYRNYYLQLIGELFMSVFMVHMYLLHKKFVL
jgi:hypothetical protein